MTKEKQKKGDNLYSRIVNAAMKNSPFFTSIKALDKLDNNIVEQTQRTIGGATGDIAQETLQLGNFLADKANLYELDDDLHERQQETLANILSNIYGEESLERVKRGGREIVKVKEPEYFGGSFVRDIGSIIGSVVVGTKGVDKLGRLAMKTNAGKEVANNIAKSKIKTATAKTAKVATGATIGEQVSINPYEARLANFIGEMIEDDDTKMAELLQFLEADDTKTEGEARLGLLIEGMAFTLGLPAAFFGGKAVKEAFKDSKVAMKTFEKLRADVQSGKLDINVFKDAINAARSKYKSMQLDDVSGTKLRSFPSGIGEGLRSVKEKVGEVIDAGAETFGSIKAELAERNRAPNIERGKVKKQLDIQESDEDISKLWQFSSNKLKRAIATFGTNASGNRRLGIGFQELFRTRGYMTPKMFAIFNKSQEAKNAWVDATETFVQRLDYKTKQLTKQYKKYGNINTLKNNIDAVLSQANPDLVNTLRLEAEPDRFAGRNYRISFYKALQDKVAANKSVVDNYDNFIKESSEAKAADDLLKAFDKLPEALRDDVGEIRLLMDDFSELFLQLPNSQISKELKETIGNNLGSYLHRSFQAFETTDFAKKSLENYNRYLKGEKIKYTEGAAFYDDFDAATKYFVGLKQGQSKYKNSSEAVILRDAEQEIRKFYTDIAKETTGADNYFARMNGFFGTDRSILKRKNDIADPILGLLGEIKDPSANIIKTVTNLSNFIEDTRFANEVYSMLKGRIARKQIPEDGGSRLGGRIFTESFLDTKTGINYNTQIKGPQYGALNGKFVTEEMAMMLGQRQGLTNFFMKSDSYKFFLQLKGYAQASKTVLNHITHLRNTVGGAIFTLANGNNPFKGGANAYSAIVNRRFNKLGKQERLDYYNELISKGVVQSGVKFGELEQLLKEAGAAKTRNTMFDFITRKVPMSKGFLDNVAKKTNKTIDNIQNAYIAEDDFFKIVAYEQELDSLIKAAKKSTFKRGNKKYTYDEFRDINPDYINTLKDEAANIVKMTMPTYNLVPTGVKQLRQLPIGNFFSFPAEMVRTSINMAKIGSKELFLSGNTVTRARGARRLGGLMAVAGLGSEATSRMTKMWHGVSDEEEQALRFLNPYDYSKNSQFIYFRDKNGKLYKNDFSFIDPYDALKRPIRTAIFEFAHGKKTEEDLDKLLLQAGREGVQEFFRPFVGEALLTETLTSLYRGKTQEGYPIEGWDNANVAEKTVIAMRELYSTFLPGAFREIPKLAKAFDDTYETSGYADILEDITAGKTGEKTYSPAGQIIANLTGFRFEKVDIELDLKRKARIYLREFDDSRKLLNKQFGSKRKDGNDVLAGVTSANAKHYYAYKDLQLAFYAAERLGMNPVVRNDILKEAKIPRKTRIKLEMNRYESIMPTTQQLEDFSKENNTKPMGVSILEGYLSKFSNVYDRIPVVNISLAGEEDTVDSESELITTRKDIEFVRKPEKTAIKGLYSSRPDAIDVEEIKERIKKNLATGGLIEGPDVVPNTKENPAERINPFTNEPYVENEDTDRVELYLGGTVTMDNADLPSDFSDKFLEEEQQILDDMGESPFKK